MLSLELPVELEQHFREVVQKDYHGSVREAFSSLLTLHDKYGWKEQLSEDVKAIRKEVRKRGGVNSQAIDDAITKYRKTKSI